MRGFVCFRPAEIQAIPVLFEGGGAKKGIRIVEEAWPRLVARA
jgi:hypothetical protein